MKITPLTDAEWERLEAWADGVFDRNEYRDGTLLDTLCCIRGVRRGLDYHSDDATESGEKIFSSLPPKGRRSTMVALYKRVNEIEEVIARAILATIDGEPD